MAVPMRAGQLPSPHGSVSLGLGLLGLGRSDVCVFGLIHFFAAAELPSSRPPKPDFHISSFICGSSQRVNPLFQRTNLVVLFLVSFLHQAVYCFCSLHPLSVHRGGYLFIHSASCTFNNTNVEDSAANTSWCLCASRAPGRAPLFACFIC